MTLTIELSPETESRLLEWAQATGCAPESLVVRVLQERLAIEPPSPAGVKALAEFDAWLAAHPGSQTTSLDDSRERIYEGRGE